MEYDETAMKIYQTIELVSTLFTENNVAPEKEDTAAEGAEDQFKKENV